MPTRRILRPAIAGLLAGALAGLLAVAGPSPAAATTTWLSVSTVCNPRLERHAVTWTLTNRANSPAYVSNLVATGLGAAAPIQGSLRNGVVLAPGATVSGVQSIRGTLPGQTGLSLILSDTDESDGSLWIHPISRQIQLWRCGPPLQFP